MIQIAKGQKPTRVILRNGIQIDAPEDIALLSIVEEVFFNHVYNPVDLPIEANDIVVDIGANIGVFTLFAAYRTRKTVYAFEPFPKNVEFLNRNIRINRLHNVIVHNTAVCDIVGPVKLFLSETSERHSLFDYSIESKMKRYIEVPSVTLQHIMDNIVTQQIDFLKMDCEGAEGSILLSTPTDYLKRITKIAMEFHDHLSRLNRNEIQGLLEEADFVTKLNWNGRSTFGNLYGKRNYWRDMHARSNR